MSVEAFTRWIEHGLAHLREGRPADAIPCLRRAAREDPRSPLPHYHLGEAHWRLGQSADAHAAWQHSARLGPEFVPPRLALCEVALVHEEYAQARVFAEEARALAPDDIRVHATALATAAAEGNHALLESAARAIADDPALRAAPALAGALARALEVAGADASHPAVAVLVPHALELPPRLAAAIAERGVPMPDALAARRWTLDDRDALRRIAVASQARAPELARRLAVAYCSLATACPPPPVPLLWPRRTGGPTLRVAWLCPPDDSPARERWLAMLAEISPALAGLPMAHALLTIGENQSLRDCVSATTLSDAPILGLSERPDATAAKAVALHDFDVLVDMAGMSLASAEMLAAQPARAVWAFTAGNPSHCAPLVDREFIDAQSLARALADLMTALSPEPRMEAAALAALWDDAVSRHQHGDLDGAAAGYARILGEQPEYAPALHLKAMLAQHHGESASAMKGLLAAVASAPGFVEARLAAGDLALENKDAPLAIRLAREGLERFPHDAKLWQMLGLAELARHDGVAAAQAFHQHLLRSPASAEGHYNHGVALQMQGDTQGAARAYQRSLTFAPDMIAADFNLGVLFAQADNRAAAIAAYRNVLTVDPRHVAAYKNLGEVLVADGQIDAWIANFRQFEAHCPDALPLAVQALEVCQHLADFPALQKVLDGLKDERYRARDEQELVDCLEELLFLLLNFDVLPETMLRFAQTYDAAATRVYGAPLPKPPSRRPGPIRLGYLSGDMRNHVMGKMLWQAIQHHDRKEFEIHFYSTSAIRDEWTQRFENLTGRFEMLAAVDDDAAAARIASNDLDILVDLSTHTRGARPAILARKPARVQVTHVASAGTVGLSAVDFKLTDYYADVPENQDWQIERLLPMEGCVYPFRQVDPAPSHPFARNVFGIGGDAVVIGAFVSPLKLSRRCLGLWRDVLEAIPRARIVFSPAQPAFRASYLRLAKAAGIAEDRLVFIPQGRDDAENQARFHMVDFVLDTMPYGGVNGTIEALAMKVPVVTLVGKRHGERSSYTILRNLGVTQTIAHSGRDFVAIAVRLAEDPEFGAGVRAAIAAGLADSPLVDMRQHTRHLEAAYRRALADAGPQDGRA